MPISWLVLSLLTVTVIAVGSARAAGFDPHDFDVSMTQMPNIDAGSAAVVEPPSGRH